MTLVFCVIVVGYYFLCSLCTMFKVWTSNHFNSAPKKRVHLEDIDDVFTSNTMPLKKKKMSGFSEGIDLEKGGNCNKFHNYFQ